METNNQVDWFVNWNDYGDVEAFFLNPGFSSRRKEAGHSSAVSASEEQVRECLRIHALLEDHRALDLPVARWRKSKWARTTGEQLIEIRIALESVLLGDDTGTGEKRHRLATRGAWLTGKTFEERRSHFETLKRVYDYASSVIHGGTPKGEGGAGPCARHSGCSGLVPRGDPEAGRQRNPGQSRLVRADPRPG